MPPLPQPTPMQFVKSSDENEQTQLDVTEITASTTKKNEIADLVNKYYVDYPKNSFKTKGIFTHQLIDYLNSNKFTVNKYMHAGKETLRFESVDGNTYNITQMANKAAREIEAQAPSSPTAATGKGFQKNKVKLAKLLGIKAGLNYIKQKHGDEIHNLVRQKLIQHLTN